MELGLVIWSVHIFHQLSLFLWDFDINDLNSLKLIQQQSCLSTWISLKQRGMSDQNVKDSNMKGYEHVLLTGGIQVKMIVLWDGKKVIVEPIRLD